MAGRAGPPCTALGTFSAWEELVRAAERDNWRSISQGALLQMLYRSATYLQRKQAVVAAAHRRVAAQARRWPSVSFEATEVRRRLAEWRGDAEEIRAVKAYADKAGGCGQGHLEWLLSSGPEGDCAAYATASAAYMAAVVRNYDRGASPAHAMIYVDGRYQEYYILLEDLLFVARVLDAGTDYGCDDDEEIRAALEEARSAIAAYRSAVTAGVYAESLDISANRAVSHLAARLNCVDGTYGRRDALRSAVEMGEELAVLRRLAEARIVVARRSTVVLPPRYDREVGPGLWTVGRSAADAWLVEHVSVGGELWTIANRRPATHAGWAREDSSQRATIPARPAGVTDADWWEYTHAVSERGLDRACFAEDYDVWVSGYPAPVTEAVHRVMEALKAS